MKTAIFPGSFDPFTKGHYDLIQRSLDLFDRVIIAVSHNSKKNKRYFELEWMVQKIKEIFENESRIEIEIYNQLTASLAKKYNAGYMIRGLRNTTDFEYENSISQINRSLNKNLETIFLITSPEFAPISSTVIREVHRYGGDVNPFVPYKFSEKSIPNQQDKDIMYIIPDRDDLSYNDKKSLREKLRSTLHKFTNNILDKSRKKKEKEEAIKEFLIFFKDTYTAKNLELSAIYAGSDSSKIEKYTSMIQEVHKFQKSTKKPPVKKPPVKKEVKKEVKS